MTLLKIIVVVLVLANVGYFLWTRDIAHPLEAAAEAPIATLKLTSEVPGSERSAPQPAAEVDAGSPSGASGIAGPGGANAPVTPGVAAPGIATPGIARPSAAAPSVAAPGVAAPGVATPGIARPSAAAPGVAAPGLATPGAGSASLLTSAKRCISVGPFRDVSEAAHAASTLRSVGYDPRQRVGERDLYWIEVDLKPTDTVLKPSDLQSETGRIQRLEVKACPSAGAVP